MNTPTIDLVTTNLPDDYSCRQGQISTRTDFLTDQPKATVDWMKAVTGSAIYYRLGTDYLRGTLSLTGKEACYDMILQLRLWREDLHDSPVA